MFVRKHKNENHMHLKKEILGHIKNDNNNPTDAFMCQL